MHVLSRLFFYIIAFIIFRISSCNTTPLDPRGAWRDPKIDNNRQNPQETCSKTPGRVFSEGAEPPEAGHHPSHSSGAITTSGGPPSRLKMSMISRDWRSFSKNVDFQSFKI